MVSRSIHWNGKGAASVLLALGAAWVSSCTSTSTQTTARQPYHAKAHRPNNPSNVRVKVSLANQMVYVMEGDRPLLVTPTCVGTAAKPTPAGNFRITIKTAKRRSNSYGFYHNPSTGQLISNQGNKRPPGWRYVGYPLPYWCEFKSAYGFHGGWVHPTPRSHGCLRLHQNVAPKFFALVNVGTPVNIARTQPEDATIGQNVPRPADYNDPEYPAHILTTDQIFSLYQGEIFEN
ncbi:MAG TPA: L,D-transpeptidase [Verrucomicrobiales bacterium]|nr:L,D-transpeptidase [Verrucomicrobiales bacterium]